MTDRDLIERMAKAMCEEYSREQIYILSGSLLAYQVMARAALRVVVNEKRRRRRAARIGNRRS